MKGKNSILCIRTGAEDNNYICYKISRVLFERLQGTRRTVSGESEKRVSKAYFLLSDVLEGYLPEKEWDNLTPELKLFYFTVKAGSVLLYDTTTTPVGKFSDLLSSSSNALSVVSSAVYIQDSSVDNIELEVM